MLLWFRNDLRTHDNPALADFLAQRSQQAHGANASNNPSKAIFLLAKSNGATMIGRALKLILLCGMLMH